MNEPIDTIEKNGYTGEIYPNQDAESPREWDNVGIMICFHKRYSLGDKHDLKSNSFGGWEEVKEYLIKEMKAKIILPLYLYEHSGITISTTPFSCRFDSGQVGFIYTTAEKIKEAYGVKHITKKVLEKATKCLQGEVETYDQYLTGEVYGYKVFDEYGEEYDSCWGFYGDKTVREEIETEFEYLEKTKEERAVKHKKEMIEAYKNKLKYAIEELKKEGYSKTEIEAEVNKAYYENQKIEVKTR